MRRDELIKMTAAATDCPFEYVAKIIDAYIDVIAQALQTSDFVELRADFGNFVVREKGGIQDGKQIEKIQRIVSFKATPTGKKRLRQSDEAYLKMLQKSEAYLQRERLLHSKHQR